ncbi:MAG: hypothetical protein QJR03_13935 [Sphaerobacter sp.]|nr:hypothetical protein [Sphaerobacter sp.]
MALTVVTGPPTAGKTSWVLARAKPGDIVIDYDRLAVALTGPGADSHDHSQAVKAVALAARRVAINEALRHADTVDVYVIHTMPSEQSQARYREHGAHIIVLDPGRDVVLRRCEELRQPAMRAAVERWYAQRRNLPPSTPQSSRAW